MLARALAKFPEPRRLQIRTVSGLLPLRVATACFAQSRGNESLFTFADGFWSPSVVIVQQIYADRAFARTIDFMTTATAVDQEQGSAFLPRFDAQGLLTAIAVDSLTREILMVAFMDTEALAKTRETGLAHFHSRSRGRLWMKGETSGHVLRVEEIRVDCDQDALVMLVRPEGPACHTGATSCFYRRLEGDRLAPID
jgi:phosphoribosyl-AMP cyclohydrolase